MVRNNLYDQLINSEPLGFIDPLTDLGEFDIVQMKFKAPVHQLKNKYSGQPYSKKWQSKIEEMRKLYIQYQLSLQEKDKKEEYYKREKTTDSKEYSNEIVTTYLKLGFSFRDIEKQVSISYRTLQRRWNRSDYVQTIETEFYLKSDLSDGYYLPGTSLPKSMKVN